METESLVENKSFIPEFFEHFEKNLMDKIQQLINKSQGDVIQSGGVKTVYYCYGERANTLAEPVCNYIPEQLATDQALKIKENLINEGMLDDNWQPIGLSGPERGLLASGIAQALDIKNMWQVFGYLWNEKPDTLRKYYNRAFDQSKSLDFQDRLKAIIAH